MKSGGRQTDTRLSYKLILHGKRRPNACSAVVVVVTVTGVFPPGRVIEGIHYHCDKADPLKDLTRVSSLDSCPDKSGRNRGLSYSSEDTFLRNCTKMQLFIIHPRSSGRAKINDEKHGAFCPHGCHLE